ncbi:MAG: hypothetical protein MK137_09680 [Rickettsiales bacterium]|nr:hypothetical protein [Rickettsiales bacterium]
MRSILSYHLSHYPQEYNTITPYHEPLLHLSENNLAQTLDEFISQIKAKPSENKMTRSFMAVKKLFDDQIKNRTNVSIASPQDTKPHSTTYSDDVLIWGGNANVLYDMNQQNLLNPALKQLKSINPNRTMILAVEAIDSRFYQTILPSLIRTNNNYIDGIVEGQISPKMRTGPVEKPAGTLTLSSQQTASIKHQMRQERKELMDNINKERSKPLPIISDKRFGHFEKGINMPFHMDYRLKKQALTPQNTPSIA